MKPATLNSEKNNTKRTMKLFLSVLAGVTALTLLQGCATSKPKEQALVCPQCKVVTITPRVPIFDGEGKPLRLRGEQTETYHSCPGCHGALATFFKEGKFQHKCSICERERSSCPVAHRPI